MYLLYNRKIYTIDDMKVRYTGLLIILCSILIITAGCTAPPPVITEQQEMQTPTSPTGTAVPAATPTAPVHSDYVTIVTPGPTPFVPPDIQTPVQDLGSEPGIDRKIIYSERNEFLSNEITLIVNVPRAPLIIDLDIIPQGLTRVKEGTSRYGERRDYRYQIYHISGNVWFLCTVEDAETGAVIVRDGFGRTFSHDSRREIVIRRPGIYHVTFSGNMVTTDIEMSIPKEPGTE